MFSKCNVPGPIGSRGHSHTAFSNGRFHERQSSFHIDVRMRRGEEFFPFPLLFQGTLYRFRNQSLAIFFGNEDAKTLFGVPRVTTHQASWAGILCKYCKGLPRPSAYASLMSR